MDMSLKYPYGARPRHEYPETLASISYRPMIFISLKFPLVNLSMMTKLIFILILFIGIFAFDYFVP